MYGKFEFTCLVFVLELPIRCTADDLRENVSQRFGVETARRDNGIGCVRISYAQLVTCVIGSEQTM